MLPKVLVFCETISYIVSISRCIERSAVVHNRLLLLLVLELAYTRQMHVLRLQSPNLVILLNLHGMGHYLLDEVFTLSLLGTDRAVGISHSYELRMLRLLLHNLILVDLRLA